MNKKTPPSFFDCPNDLAFLSRLMDNKFRGLPALVKPMIQEEIRSPKIIIDFLSGTGEDSIGRTHKKILSSNDKEMEVCNDKIQWLFPLHERSDYARFCPIIDAGIVSKCNLLPEVSNNLRRAELRMRDFYGIGGANVSKLKINEWLTPMNHNLLRITRIIRSLRLFGLDLTARAFYDDVMTYSIRLGESGLPAKTAYYWGMAMFDDSWSSLKKEPPMDFLPLRQGKSSQFSFNSRESFDSLDSY